jgi:hypothetical protein
MEKLYIVATKVRKQKHILTYNTFAYFVFLYEKNQIVHIWHMIPRILYYSKHTILHTKF